MHTIHARITAVPSIATDRVVFEHVIHSVLRHLSSRITWIDGKLHLTNAYDNVEIILQHPLSMYPQLTRTKTPANEPPLITTTQGNNTLSFGANIPSMVVVAPKHIHSDYVTVPSKCDHSDALTVPQASTHDITPTNDDVLVIISGDTCSHFTWLQWWPHCPSSKYSWHRNNKRR